MISMTDMKIRIRSVSMNSRGQIVIPEEFRKNLGLSHEEALILIEKNGEITMRKESSVAKNIDSEEGFWQRIAEESLENAWAKEDKKWEKIAKEDLK